MMKNILVEMKKKVVIIVAGVLLLSGCSTGVSENEQGTDSVVAAPVTADSIETTTDKQVPDRKAEISGVVKNIIGNEVTIALLLRDSASQTESGVEEGVELTDEEKAAKQAAKKAENAAKAESGTTSTKEIELSGETIDIIIPVGTTILQSTGTGVFNSVEIADIYTGMSVKVWTQSAEEGGTDLVEFVQILTQ